MVHRGEIYKSGLPQHMLKEILNDPPMLESKIFVAWVNFITVLQQYLPSSLHLAIHVAINKILFVIRSTHLCQEDYLFLLSKHQLAELYTCSRNSQQHRFSAFFFLTQQASLSDFICQRFWVEGFEKTQCRSHSW